MYTLYSIEDFLNSHLGRKTALLGAFEWAESEEGYEYWEGIYGNYLLLLKEEGQEELTGIEREWKLLTSNQQEDFIRRHLHAMTVNELEDYVDSCLEVIKLIKDQEEEI